MSQKYLYNNNNNNNIIGVWSFAVRQRACAKNCGKRQYSGFEPTAPAALRPCGRRVSYCATLTDVNAACNLTHIKVFNLEPNPLWLAVYAVNQSDTILAAILVRATIVQPSAAMLGGDAQHLHISELQNRNSSVKKSYIQTKNNNADNFKIIVFVLIIIVMM